MSETTQRKHHPDCPALFFTDKPQRCRCMFLAVLDRPRVTPPQAARDLLAETLLNTVRPIALDDAADPHYWRRLADAILASPALDAIVAERVAALAEDEAIRFSDEDIENAHEAMQEGEWQWFQWLLREKVRALAAALTYPRADA